MSKVFITLIHYPVYDKNKNIVTTSITNFDLHDISRTAKTYGIEKYILIHPMESQHFFAQRIIDHWCKGYGSVYNKNRKEALSLIKMLYSFEECIEYIEKNYQKKVITVATSARKFSNTITYKKLKEELQNNDLNYLLVFGTGWGLHDEIVNRCTYILEPIKGPTDYNHLSVRAAVAIILDRLLGQ